jgi:multidrug efflux pump subunit AcrB
VFQVRAQADQRFRVDREDIQKLKVRSATGALVPLGTLVNVVDAAGPDLVQRYNMYVSVPIQGNAAPGTSSGQALAAMERIAADSLPPGMSPSSGPSSRCSRPRPATPRSTSSRSPSCSCSWRWRRSTRAGCCRSPSS